MITTVKRVCSSLSLCTLLTACPLPLDPCQDDPLSLTCVEGHEIGDEDQNEAGALLEQRPNHLTGAERDPTVEATHAHRGGDDRRLTV